MEVVAMEVDVEAVEGEDMVRFQVQQYWEHKIWINCNGSFLKGGGGYGGGGY